MTLRQLAILTCTFVLSGLVMGVAFWLATLLVFFVTGILGDVSFPRSVTHIAAWVMGIIAGVGFGAWMAVEAKQELDAEDGQE